MSKWKLKLVHLRDKSRDVDNAATSSRGVGANTVRAPNVVEAFAALKDFMLSDVGRGCVWVACTLCGKRRRLYGLSPAALPTGFMCQMVYRRHWDVTAESPLGAPLVGFMLQTCEHPEEVSAADDLEL